MDVSTWLRDLGLEDYAQAFQANHIDAEVLPRLTADDLAALGITSVGHRRRLLDAIVALDQGTAPAFSESTTVAARPLEAERRQLTLLFCDLVGSTELTARFDPEDMGQVIRAYHGACTEVVERWGGHVAKYMGDGVLAYFGWPQAHEDDAERAVRAGLELADDVTTLDTLAGKTLAARIGIATGLVMVGELIGEGAAREQTVVGETPNLAARLQAWAQPSAVVIAPSTRRLLGEIFELADLGACELKGIAAPIHAWRVLGESHAESRFEALHGGQITALVGREHELGLLADRWERAKEGDGQVVLLSGEPGIGKSRLVRALREHLVGEPCTPLSHYCSPYHTNSALYPVIGLLERAARLDRDQPPKEQLARLEAVLGRARDQLDEVVPLLAALLGVPTDARYPALTMTPEVQKRRTLQALLDQLEALAAHQPVLALYEDVHWMDPSTLELLSMVIERIRQLRVLALITFRPEFQPPWAGQAHVTTLTMSRLGRRQGADLVARVTGDKPLPTEVVDQIVARTDGVPLFVEELTKAVLESGLLTDAGDHYELSGPLPPLAIPTTLHDSLMARLDRVAPVKEVAQVGAVIGREFSHELLAAVDGRPEPELQAALDQLVQSELIFRRGTPPDATYSFKHALVHQAAYQSLLKSKRQRLHGCAAQLLEKEFPEVAAAEPEALARHYGAAGFAEQAIACWQRAARNAVERSANIEAAAFLRSALEVLLAQQETSKRRRTEARLQLSLGAALIPPKGYAAEAVRVAFARAEELARLEHDWQPLFLALRGLWNCHILRGELRDASALAEQLIDLAGESPPGSSRLLMAYRAAGTSSFLRGNLKTALDHLRRGESLWNEKIHQEYINSYGEDPGLLCRVYGTWIRDLMGSRDRALREAGEALERARGFSDRFSLAIGLAYASTLHLFRREPAAVRSYAEACIDLCSEQHIPMWQAWGAVHRGWALAAAGECQEGLVVLRQGIDQWRAIQGYLGLPHFLTLLAHVLRLGRAYAEAREALDQAEEVIRECDHRSFEVEVYQEQGELARARNEPQVAEHHFCRAMACAQDQGAKTLELRAACGVAWLWAERGERQKARDLLAPVYGWFTEGFDTADLKDAKALLDELR